MIHPTVGQITKWQGIKFITTSPNLQSCMDFNSNQVCIMAPGCLIPKRLSTYCSKCYLAFSIELLEKWVFASYIKWSFHFPDSIICVFVLPCYQNRQKKYIIGKYRTNQERVCTPRYALGPVWKSYRIQLVNMINRNWRKQIKMFWTRMYF